MIFFDSSEQLIVERTVNSVEYSKCCPMYSCISDSVSYILYTLIKVSHKAIQILSRACIFPMLLAIGLVLLG